LLPPKTVVKKGVQITFIGFRMKWLGFFPDKIPDNAAVEGARVKSCRSPTFPLRGALLHPAAQSQGDAFRTV
jgi:hypothetical protein